MSTPPSQARKALIIFMRCPEPGRVKTRLAAAIGQERASRVYEKLARMTLGVAADFAGSHPDVTVFIFYDPPEKSLQMEQRFPGPWNFMPQRGPHLGLRMGNAIQQVMARGFGPVVLVGSDLASPSQEDYAKAFEALQGGLVPLGPAEDGGFYLIGLNGYCPSPFEPRQWGEGAILERTRRLLHAEGFHTRDLPIKRDVDRKEDLECLHGHFFHESQLSVIIPTVADPGEIQWRSREMQRQLWPGDEIVISSAEGGPPCPQAGEGHVFRCVQGPKGRGRQLNRGALAAGNNLLLFLHDDSVPPPQFPYLVRKALQKEEVSLGCFSLRFRPSSPSLELIARWANIRSAFMGMPYGDQGLFCRREIFDKVSGFQQPFIFEDVEFVRSCKSHGKLEILNAPVTSSSRRYLRKGVLKTALHNHFMVLLYCLGMDNRKLYDLYYGRARCQDRLAP